MTLRYHCMQTMELVQTKNSISSHSVRFSSRVLNLGSINYRSKSKLLWLKKHLERVETHKSDDLDLYV